VGALFAPSEPLSGSRHADKLFARIRNIIKDGFADPSFGPNEVAAEAGISLRYLQKLLRRTVRPAVSSYIRFAWIRRRAFCIVEDHWAQASLSAKSPTLAAFATIHISHESFDSGSVTRQVLTLKVP
jgi:AraC-like DNA-binding protein